MTLYLISRDLGSDKLLFTKSRINITDIATESCMRQLLRQPIKLQKLIKKFKFNRANNKSHKAALQDGNQIIISNT